MDKIVTIERATPYTMFIYLKASNPFSIPIVESIVKGKVVVCGSEEISLVSPSKEEYNQLVGSAMVTKNVGSLFKNSD